MATHINATVLKAFDVLELFGPERPEITAGTVAAELGLSRATAHRFLATLEAAGVLVAVGRGVFAPGPRLTRLGRMAEELNPLVGHVQDALEAIRRDLGESAMACRLSARGPLCIAVSPADRQISVNIKTGTTLPLLTTAQGKIWLAYMSTPERAALQRRRAFEAGDLDALEPELARIRADGCAFNLGSNEPDIAALAVPVLAADGHAVLTLSVFGMLSRFDADLLQRAETKLKATAARLGGSQPNAP